MSGVIWEPAVAIKCDSCGTRRYVGKSIGVEWFCMSCYEELGKCDWCGDRKPGLIEKEDSDPSVGYSAKEMVCPSCLDAVNAGLLHPSLGGEDEMEEARR